MNEHIQRIKEARKVLKTYDYHPAELYRGYTNKSLYINVGDLRIEEKIVTEEMKDKFIGGKGFGLYYLWHAVKDNTKWNDPENEVIIASGPIAGITQYPGSGKSLVVSISPTTNAVVDSNVGGHFGPYLKFSGFDALELQGKAEEPIIVFIDGNKGHISIETAPIENWNSHLLADELTEVYAENEEDKRSISVVSTGSGAEHSLIGLLNVSFYDKRRHGQRIKQAGRGGIGTVFRDKNIKAVIVKYRGVHGDMNKAEDVETIQNLGIKLHKEIHDFDDIQTKKRQVGTANLVEVMNDYDLLPVNNFKYGYHPEAWKISSDILRTYVTQNMPDGCWYGCSLACAKVADGFLLKTGPYAGQKVMVDGAEYETVAGVGANCGIFDMHYVFECNFYCDTYGIDTISWGTTVAFLMECYTAGVIDRQVTGGLDLVWGNSTAALELLHQVGSGTGFGKLAGQGVRRLKELFIKEYGADPNFLRDIGMEVKGMEYSQYMSKESLAQQGGYALTNKGPQHDEAWVIFTDMVNNLIPTFEDKAEALHYFPMFRTWFGLMGLCKLPWNDIEPADNRQQAEPAKVPEHVENYIGLYNSVTGKHIDKEEMIRQSERVYNFQRIFALRFGFGTREYDMPPYRSVGPVTKEEYLSRHERYEQQIQEKLGLDPTHMSIEEKMQKVREYREEQFQKLTDAVYKRRGWTKNGVPTVEHLKAIGMDLPEVLDLAARHASE